MTVKQKLIAALETLGFKSGETLFLQGSLGSDTAYPESFVTYWVDSTMDDAHYNNEVLSVTWAISVVYYSSDVYKVVSVPDEIRAVLKAEGFVPQGKGQDLFSDEPTHTGWQQTYLYKDYE